MIGWLHVTLIVACALILVLLFLLIFQGCFHPKTRKNIVIADAERGNNLQNNGIARFHQVSPHHHHLDRSDGSKNTNSRVVSSEPLIFSWADHPSLVAEAVENGWSRFAFTALVSSPSVKSARSTILGVCGSNDHGNEIVNVEIGWDVCEGSADYMQKIRLNPGLEKMIRSVNSSSMGAVSVIRTALPLPGPCLANSSFPQDSYFEITILPGKENNDRSEDERIKLIGEDFNAKSNPNTLAHVISSNSQRRNKIDEAKFGGKQDDENEVIFVSVGLTGEGPLQRKFPGSFPGSIGFNSTGSVYLDGTNLVSESEKNEWGRAEQIIGCGYNPSQKKVFFTVDSKLAHEIHCKTQEFTSPLYPTLAANTDITVVVNLGQIPFKFAPANLQTTPNPYSIRPPDSDELFSMGRIDSNSWLQRNATGSNNNTVNSIKSIELFDQESEEGDLFEIVLDSTQHINSFRNICFQPITIHIQ